MLKRFLPLAIILLAGTGLFSQQLKITISANGLARQFTPVSFVSANPLPPGEYLLTNQQTKKQYPAQVSLGSVVNFILPDRISGTGTLNYSLQKTKQATKKKIKVLETSAGISVQVAGKEIFYYHKSIALPPSDSPAYYQRSGFIHPLRSPAGNIITDDFPAGHAHQHGIMMAWVSTMFRNTSPDFWNQQNRKGNVRHVKVLSTEEGTSAAVIRLQLEHYTDQYGNILNEIWTITCYPFEKYFLFDIISEQQNISTDSLIMKKYHYGGMEFRGSRKWNEDDKKHFTNKWSVRTDSGFDMSNANARHAAFVDVSGKIAGKTSGTTVFSFPSNFRYPEPIRLHPTMPYWCFAPTVEEGFSIAPGGKHISRYRYYVYDGAPDQEKISAINNDILHPLQIEQQP